MVSGPLRKIEIPPELIIHFWCAIHHVNENLLSRYLNHIVVHGMWIYLESKTGSMLFHTQTGTLYP